MNESSPAYSDPTLSVPVRVRDLVARLTLAEKIGQLVHDAPAIERLGIPSYNWWNECLHGVGRAGIATVFPQAIGLAAAWNTDLMHQVATVIADEARAKHHDALRHGVHKQYLGLTFWTPNINIFRDPRWGRGQETYGEDPYLTSRLAVRFIKGLQGDDPRYLKLVATAKHYAVHSGPEHARHRFDARVDNHDLYETYLPAFEVAVQEAKVASIMSAYNRTNGEACSASPTLLQHILRDSWGFDGYVVSDCGAITDIYAHHQVVQTPAEASALAVNAGCDLECGCEYAALVEAVQKGLITEPTIDQAVTRLFTARFRLGMFDPPAQVPYAQIPIEVNDSPAHRALALRAAQESMVLLKNANNLLPLRHDLKTIAVIGPNADDVEVLLGNYNGQPSRAVTPLEGIRTAVAPGTEVVYARGCEVGGRQTDGFADAVAAARRAEVVLFVAGLSQQFEGEEGQQEGLPAGMHSDGDRADLSLPGAQEDLLKALHATGTPVVLILINGSAIAVNWASDHIPAILEAWYPGEEGGTAIADVLFGDYNPGGRLPVTFYKTMADLPPFEDYRMEGRTYRYFRGEPLYPFGCGLSYTTFAYDHLRTEGASDSRTVRIDVRNTGSCAGDEVVELYLHDVAASVRVPIWQLAGFERIHLQAGETKTVTFTLASRQFAIVDHDGKRVVEPGEFVIAVGGGLPDTAYFNGRKATVTINA